MTTPINIKISANPDCIYITSYPDDVLNKDERYHYIFYPKNNTSTFDGNLSQEMLCEDLKDFLLAKMK